MRRGRVLFAAFVAAASLGLWACEARSAGETEALVLERAVPLAGVGGRIDHLAVDEAHGRLFVAELENGSVEAIDLGQARSLGRITGLAEPQGVGYLAAADEIAVATGGDGMLRFYRAADLRPAGGFRLGEDADDVRTDGPRLLVGYGQALAVVDAAGRRLVRSIPLPAHPEGFEADGTRAYVNLPNAGGIGIVDLAAGRQAALWRNPGPHFNFPLGLDRPAGRVASVYRLPATLVVFTVAGQVEQKLATCGDADDVFFDNARGRLYVVCGGGAVDVFAKSQGGYRSLARIATRPGARTGFFSAKLDRLFVAAPARNGRAAEMLIYRPR